MESDTLGILALFTFMAGFAIFFFFVVYKMVNGFGKRSSKVLQKTVLTKEQLNTVVKLSPEEQKKMTQGLWIALGIFGILIGGIVGIKAWNYSRFVLDGESVQATVLDVIYKTSGTRKHRSRDYVYVLEAEVGGKTVQDTYSVGPMAWHQEGDVVKAYATSGANRELAVAQYEDLDLVWIIGGVMLFCAIIVVLQKQRKKILSGEVTVASLPKYLQQKKLGEVDGVSQSSQEVRDGRDYRVSS